MFRAAGVKPGDTIIGYCHIGQQATAMLFAARTLGYNVLLYDGSFTEWQKKDLPVENPSVFEFIVNTRTAAALGINFPPEVAAQVTEWIE